MRVFKIRGIAPDASAIASEAFARSWHFIERDPVLAGHDRDTLKAQLALEIQRAMANVPHLDLLRIANRAIARVREEMRERERRSAEAMFAS
jgi:ribosomal protein L29